MKTADKFYLSQPWYRLRQKALMRDRHRCVNCGVAVVAKGSARVDHIMPRRTHPHMELLLSNVRCLCIACDNARHARDRNSRHKGKEIARIRDDGFPEGW